MSNFMKIRPVGRELFHADGREIHDEASSRFSQFFERAQERERVIIFSLNISTTKRAASLAGLRIAVQLLRLPTFIAA